MIVKVSVHLCLEVGDPCHANLQADLLNDLEKIWGKPHSIYGPSPRSHGRMSTIYFYLDADPTFPVQSTTPSNPEV